MLNTVAKKLNHNLKIIMIDKKDKNSVNNLLKDLVFSNSDTFFNINEGDDEISIVLDESLEQLFKNNKKIIIDPNVYKVIQIHHNKSGISDVGTVAQISSLFSDINIPILYFNTFKYNFVLIKKENYERAWEALQIILN